LQNDEMTSEDKTSFLQHPNHRRSKGG